MLSSPWRSVLALTMTSTITSGVGFYGVSLYMASLTATGRFSPSWVSATSGLFFLASGASGLLAGRLMVRRDVRPLMLGGAVCVGACLILIGRIDQLWQMVLVYFALGLGYAFVALVPTTTLLNRWFEGKRRSIMLSIAMSGLSLGGIFVLPLVEQVIDIFGFADGMTLIGIGTGLALAATLGLLRGSGPSFAQPAREDRPQEAGIPYADALRTRFFLFTTLCFFLVFGSQVGAIAHLYSRVQQLLEHPSLAIAFMALSSMAFRFVGGVMIPRMSLRAFTALWTLLQCLGLAIISSAHHAWVLLAGAVVFGAAIGNTWLVQPLVMATFGMRDYPRIYAASQFVSMIGLAGGPLLLGLMFVHFGYVAAYILGASLSALGLLTLLAAGAVPVRPRDPSGRGH